MGEVWSDFRAALLQVGDVAIAVIWYSSLPDAKQYSDPTASYFSYRSVVLHPAVAEHAISGFAPRTISSGTLGKFVKGLPEILGASVPPVDSSGLTALDSDRRDPAERRQALGIFPAVSL